MKKLRIVLLAFFLSLGVVAANETPTPTPNKFKGKNVKKAPEPGIPQDNLKLFRKMQTQINESTVALDQSGKEDKDKKSELERLLAKQKSLLSKFKEASVGKKCPEALQAKIDEAASEMQNVVKRFENGLADNVTQLKQKRIISLLNEMITK